MMKMKYLCPLSLLLFLASICRAEECGDMQKVHRKFQTCQRKEFIAYQNQGGTMCQLLENIIETCDSLWYYCVKSQQQILFNKRNYVQKFISRYPDESLTVENCPYIQPFSSELETENEVDSGPRCTDSKRRSVDTEFTRCIYNYAAMVNSNLTDPSLPHRKVVYTMCQAMRNLTSDCFQLLHSCFSAEERQQMETMSTTQMIATMLNLGKDGITESTLKQCDQDLDITTQQSDLTTSSVLQTTTVKPWITTMSESESTEGGETTLGHLDVRSGFRHQTTLMASAEEATTTESPIETTTANVEAELSTTTMNDNLDVYADTTPVDSTTAFSVGVEEVTSGVLSTTIEPFTAKDDIFLDDSWAVDLEDDKLSDDSVGWADTTPSAANFLSDDHAVHDNSDGVVITTATHGDNSDPTVDTGDVTEPPTAAAENVVIGGGDNKDKVPSPESSTLSVEIQYEVSGPELDAKDSMYTSDFNSVDYVAADRRPLAIDDRSTPDPDTQKRSSPDVVVSERSSSGCGVDRKFAPLMAIATAILYLF